MAESNTQEFRRLSLDWAVAEVKTNPDCITIFAEKIPTPSLGHRSEGYQYRAHIKWDPNATWEKNIPKNATEWEVKQRDTPLWETVLGDDYNYEHQPWKHRPPIDRLVSILKEKGASSIADRIQEAYQHRNL